jgi:mannose-6-phosphate isomerase class I
MYELKQPQKFQTADESGKGSAQILVAVEGCAAVEVGGIEAVTLAKGDAVVIPAGSQEFCVRPQWSVELLKSSVPGRHVTEPETRI